MKFALIPWLVVAISCGGSKPPSAVSSCSNGATVCNRPTEKVGPSVSIALVMSGWELWIGNDKEVPEILEDDPSRYPGILVDLRAALDHNQLNVGPPGSQGMVITYGDKPVIRVPMGPLANLTGASLGTQRDYFGATGSELVSGIRLALASLSKVQTERRVLIVVCDGNDTNNEEAKTQLVSLKKQAATLGVQTFAIVYKSVLSNEANIMPVMIPDAVTINSSSNVDTALGSILAKIK